MTDGVAPATSGPADGLGEATAAAARLAGSVANVVRGKPEQIRLVVAAVAAGGHVLFEDVPGTAKTVLARALAASVEGAAFSRIQCTPDLQPTDVTGLSIYDAARARVRVPPRAGVHEHPARRRDQPGDAEDPVGAVRGDGGGPGHRRRRDAPPAEAVSRPRHAEPDRAGGDVPAPGGAARPLRDQDDARLPVARRRDRDHRRAARPPPARRRSAGRHDRRPARPPVARSSTSTSTASCSSG